jgi:hypothetical protein
MCQGIIYQQALNRSGSKEGSISTNKKYRAGTVCKGIIIHYKRTGKLYSVIGSQRMSTAQSGRLQQKHAGDTYFMICPMPEMGDKEGKQFISLTEAEVRAWVSRSPIKRRGQFTRVICPM